MAVCWLPLDGCRIDALERSGAIELLWHSQGEHVLDELRHRLLDEVGRRGGRPPRLETAARARTMLARAGETAPLRSTLNAPLPP